MEAEHAQGWRERRFFLEPKKVISICILEISDSVTQQPPRQHPDGQTRATESVRHMF
jgi:hypothetical protein